MVSLAAPFGTVGPHLDGYDVFLLQGRGRRRWQVGATATPEYREGLDLRILRRFRPKREWVLESGDLLYLPGAAHYGVALPGGECLTYSIGFRAPSHGDLVAGYLRQIARDVDPSVLYRDGSLRPQREPGEIRRDAIERMKRIVAGAWKRPRGRAFDRLVGKLLTTPKGGEPPVRRRRLTEATLRKRLTAGSVSGMNRAAAARVAFIPGGAGVAELFANGRSYTLPPGLAFAAPLLSRRCVSSAALRRYLGQAGFAELVLALLSDGVFELARLPD